MARSLAFSGGRARGARPPTLILAALASLLWLSVATFAAEAEEDFTGPQRYIDELGKRTLALLESETLSEEERKQEIESLLKEEVNFSFVSVVVLGPFWTQMTERQKSEYRALYQEYEIANLRERLLDYGVEDFRIGSAERRSSTDTVVHTMIVRQDGEDPEDVSWRVRRLDRRYTIIDVSYAGISSVTLRRDDFASYLGNEENGGIEGLMEWLTSQLREIQ